MRQKNDNRNETYVTTPLWSDNPSALDLLGFADVTLPISDAVLRDKLDPVTVGIQGDWGSGKTSMLRLLAAELRESPGVVVVETHPWEYDPATDPKATLIAEVLAAVHAEVDKRGGLSTTVRDKFKSLAKRVRVSKAVKLAINTALSGGLPAIADVLGLFNDEAETVPDPTLQGFRQEFKELLAMDELKDIQRVVVLVDDLDRCLPETVIATLEAVKLFLSVPKMAFVMAADRRAVAHAVATKYEPSPQALELGREYLEKIVHIPVPVPALGEADTRAYLALLMLQRHLDDDTALAPYIEHCDERRAAGKADVLKGLSQDGLDGDATDDLQLAAMLAPVLYERLHGNPRKLKRFLNAYWMRATVAGRRGIELQPHALAKLMVLEELEDTAFKAVLGWLREGRLSERLQALEAGQSPDGAGEAVLGALKEWASISPALAETEGLDSYLRLAASLRSQVGAEVGLRADVKELVEALLSQRQAERKGAVRDLPSVPQDARLLAVEYLIKRIRSNPDDQGKLGPAFAKFSEDPDVAQAMVPGLSELSPERIEPALVVSLLPKKNAQPLMRGVVRKWLESERMDAGAAEIARKGLADAASAS
ncbi:MAG: hypothetical protein QOC78_1794 [Solirubrobacteraceae bacterium]|jgi:hypothetical protein|nr:hypothetical protein [Solirubrobacteraceae bacterium]